MITLPQVEKVADFLCSQLRYRKPNEVFDSPTLDPVFYSSWKRVSMTEISRDDEDFRAAFRTKFLDLASHLPLVNIDFAQILIDPKDWTVPFFKNLPAIERNSIIDRVFIAMGFDPELKFSCFPSDGLRITMLDDGFVFVGSAGQQHTYIPLHEIGNCFQTVIPFKSALQYEMERGENIYVVRDGFRAIVYIGQTTQGISTRLQQHVHTSGGRIRQTARYYTSLTDSWYVDIWDWKYLAKPLQTILPIVRAKSRLFAELAADSLSQVEMSWIYLAAPLYNKAGSRIDSEKAFTGYIEEQMFEKHGWRVST